MNLSTPRRSALAAGLAAALALGTAAGPARALDLSWSGFATLGHARSADVPGRYLRFIDDDGSFNAESVAALQLDARLSPQWSTTLQLKLAPSERSDSRWQLQPAWAFVAWRPSDEWLLRAGRMRVPLYLHSESLDIGVSHDMARLPVEMYSLAPSNDFNGVFVTYNRAVDWLGESDLSLEGFVGSYKPTARLWRRDGLPPVLPAGAEFRKIDTHMAGAVMTLRSPKTTLRLGLTLGEAGTVDGTPLLVSPPFVQIAPGLGYFRVDPSLPGPPIETVERLRNVITTLGVEHRFDAGWRVAAELARGKQQRTELGSDTLGGYMALFKDIDRFTPYVSWGRLTTGHRQRDLYRRLMAVNLPPVIPGAAQINATQRLTAETIYAADQSTLALGLAWRAPFGGKLKLEWAQTRVGEVTRLLDTPPGQPTAKDTRFATWTLNYSLAF